MSQEKHPLTWAKTWSRGEWVCDQEMGSIMKYDSALISFILEDCSGAIVFWQFCFWLVQYQDHLRCLWQTLKTDEISQLSGMLLVIEPSYVPCTSHNSFLKGNSEMYCILQNVYAWCQKHIRHQLLEVRVCITSTVLMSNSWPPQWLHTNLYSSVEGTV